MIRNIILFLILGHSALCLSQNEKAYESKVLETDRLKVEYIDLGGEGKTLIVVQGAHNYFDESPTNPYFQSYKEVKCEKCNGTGLLPFVKNGRIILHAYIYCKCHEEEPGSDFRLPSDFDFPISYNFYCFLCQYYRWEDPGPLYGSTLII